MERNFKNYIKWQQIKDSFEVSPERERRNRDEIASLFDIEVTSDLLSSNEDLLKDAIQISASNSLSDVTVNLEIDQSPPYVVRRNDQEIQEAALSADFPFTETLSKDVTGEVIYEVENDSGNEDTSSVFHYPVEISSSTVGRETTISLELNEAPPYDISENGTSIAQNLSASEFPYVATPGTVSGPVSYEVENDLGYTDSVEVVPVETACSISGPDVTVDLSINISSSYSISRDGEFIQEGIGPSAFPYTETLGNGSAGEVTYEVENDLGFADSCTLHPIKISCSVSSSTSNIELFIGGNAPYTVRRGGTVLDQNLSDADFPFTEDVSSLSGTVTYEVENYEGNVDTSSVTI